MNLSSEQTSKFNAMIRKYYSFEKVYAMFEYSR